MPKLLRWIPPVREPYALYLMIRDPRTPLNTKLQAFSIIALIFAYAFSPIDIIPDYLPIIGWLDDLVLIPLGISAVERILPRNILAENRVIAKQKVNRVMLRIILGFLAFFLVWGLIITLVTVFIIKLVR